MAMDGGPGERTCGGAPESEAERALGSSKPSQSRRHGVEQVLGSRSASRGHARVHAHGAHHRLVADDGRPGGRRASAAPAGAAAPRRPSPTAGWRRTALRRAGRARRRRPRTFALAMPARCRLAAAMWPARARSPSVTTCSARVRQQRRHEARAGADLEHPLVALHAAAPAAAAPRPWAPACTGPAGSGTSVSTKASAR